MTKQDRSIPEAGPEYGAGPSQRHAEADTAWLRGQLLAAMRRVRTQRALRRLNAGPTETVAPTARMKTLCPSLRFLDREGTIETSVLQAATREAARHGRRGADVLISSRILGAEEYVARFARAVGARHLHLAEIAHVLLDNRRPDLSLDHRILKWCRLKDDSVLPVLTVTPADADRLCMQIERLGLSDRIAVASAATMRTALLKDHDEVMCATGSEQLALRAPLESARSGATFSQGVLLTMVVMAVGLAFAAAATTTGAVLHVAMSSFFIGCVAVRVAAACFRPDKAEPAANSASASDCPVYSILVPLLHEAEMVPGLVRHLGALDWPWSKLEIKLVCEEDDAETRRAIAASQIDERFELVVVPACGPQTKPKALSYALAFTTGTIITLFDAEDRPHPRQLHEVWQQFRHGADNLACIQAPLDITNGRRSGLAGLFALEYAGLFHKLLPWLAAHDCPIPLGGTSNHFRRSALVAVGGWDPYNVTEDADLGYRLWRNGYVTQVLGSHATLEDAPTAFAVWLPQRTRWFKGWMQTWLVHSRKPGRILQRGGFLRFCIHHAIMTGITASALLHPLFLINIAVMAAVSLRADAIPLSLTIDVVTLATSYVAFGMMGLSAMTSDRKTWARGLLVLVPIYWLAMSWAAWRALFQMFRDPHGWEKTPHAPYDPLHRHGREPLG